MSSIPSATFHNISHDCTRAFIFLIICDNATRQRQQDIFLVSNRIDNSVTQCTNINLYLVRLKKILTAGRLHVTTTARSPVPHSNVANGAGVRFTDKARGQSATRAQRSLHHAYDANREERGHNIFTLMLLFFLLRYRLRLATLIVRYQSLSLVRLFEFFKYQFEFTTDIRVRLRCFRQKEITVDDLQFFVAGRDRRCVVRSESTVDDVNYVLRDLCNRTRQHLIGNCSHWYYTKCCVYTISTCKRTSA